MNFKLLLFFSLLLLLFPVTIFSQVMAKNSDIYKWFDETVGYENTGLFNGVEYLEQHITINEKHQFFESSQFLVGDISYEGQPYFQVFLKYNVFEDLLLIKLEKRGGESSFQLHKRKVDAFNLQGHQFVHVKETKENSKISGFHEILLEANQFQLLKKHRKKRKKLLDRDYTYFEFEEDEPEYIVFYQNSYTRINNEKAVQRLFEDYRDEIRKYYRTNKKLNKSNSDRFMTGLFQKIFPQTKETSVK